MWKLMYEVFAVNFNGDKKLVGRVYSDSVEPYLQLCALQYGKDTEEFIVETKYRRVLNVE